VVVRRVSGLSEQGSADCGSRQESSRSGPRLGRETTGNDRKRHKTSRGRIQSVTGDSAGWHEELERLALTTDQEVGDSSSSGRADGTAASAGDSLVGEVDSFLQPGGCPGFGVLARSDCQYRFLGLVDVGRIGLPGAVVEIDEHE
jgi:hypothetical protein